MFYPQMSNFASTSLVCPWLLATTTASSPATAGRGGSHRRAPLCDNRNQMLTPFFAYIGPGAGFAFLGGFLSVIGGFFLTALSFLLWPIRTVRALIRRRHGFRKAKIQRLIFLGLDGLDPRLTERFMAEGQLPNLQRLQQQGSFHRLRTTFPSLSPVAWSTFRSEEHTSELQ